MKVPVDSIDGEVIVAFLDTALMHRNASNDWAEGYWIGRAVQHANQNAVDDDWLRAQMDERGLDSAVIAEPSYRMQG